MPPIMTDGIVGACLSRPSTSPLLGGRLILSALFGVLLAIGSLSSLLFWSVRSVGLEEVRARLHASCAPLNVQRPSRRALDRRWLFTFDSRTQGFAKP